MTPHRVLVVDDDPQILRALRINLTAHGYHVLLAPDGGAALRAAADGHPDVVVLDLGLPDMDGVEVIEGLRGWTTVPIIVLSARTGSADTVRALGVGADDYMTKPFSPRELVARVHALIRRVDRGQPSDPETLRIGDIAVDTVERRVRLRGDAVHLTPTEYELLLRLAERPGQVLDRDRLLNDVWGWSDGASTTRTVDSHVRALRRKLGDGVIRTVHGVGYALDKP